MNPTPIVAPLNNNSVVFTSPTNKGYSLSDFNDYDYNYQTAEKQFGQVEFSSPVVQLDSLSKIQLNTAQRTDKQSNEVQGHLSKNYSSNDLRINNHQARDKQLPTLGERLLSENSSFVRKSLNNSINVNQLSPKLSPLRNSIVSMKSSTVSEATSARNLKQSTYFPSLSKQQQDNINGVPIQIVPSQVNHVILSETTKNISSNKIIFKESKLRNSTTNLSNISQSPINKEYSSKNFHTAATATSLTDNQKYRSGESAIAQQLTSIQAAQNYNNNNSTTNNANSSFSSIQQQLGDFLNQEDPLTTHNLNSNTYQYTQSSDNSMNKQQIMKILSENNNNNSNIGDHKQFMQIQQKMLFLITENEKLIEYNESLMKENKLLKQGRDSLVTNHRLEIDDWKRKYDQGIESRDKDIRQIRDQLMRQELEMEERHREHLEKEKKSFEREQNLLRKMTLHSQEVYVTNQQITTQNIQKKVIEEASLIASEELVKRQEIRIKDLETHIVTLQNENSKLVQTLASHDSTAREQLSQAHSQSLDKIEKILQNATLDKKQLEESLRKEILSIQSEKSFLQIELSNQKNESLQMSQMVNGDISKLESDKFQALSRVNEIELKCERLIVDVQQLNTLLAERLEQIKALETVNKELQDQINNQQPQIESISTEKHYLVEENKILKIQLKEMEERQVEIIENKYEQEQLVEKYQKMTEQSQKMNQEYLMLNENNILKIQELEQAVSSSNLLVEKLDQKDHYITQLIQTIESDKYQQENQQLIEEIKRLEANHQYEIELLKKQDVNQQKIQEQEQIILQTQQEKEIMRQEFEQIKYQFEKDVQELNQQIEEEKQHNLEQIQSLKVEVSGKKDNFVKLQELEDINSQLMEQLDIKEKAFQQTCLNYEERINQEVHSHTYQINLQLTNLKAAMRQLEEDNNALKMDLDAHKREHDRQRIRYQDLMNEKEQVANQYERQIHSIAQQSERTIHNLKSEKDREMQFLQREHQRMQSLLSEKAEIITRLQQYSANQYGVNSNSNNQTMNGQNLYERYSSRNQTSITTGLTQTTSQQNLLKKNSSLNNLVQYQGLSEQDENYNMQNTIKRQPTHFMPPLPQGNNQQQQMQGKGSYQSNIAMQRYSSVQNMGLQPGDAPRYDTSLVEENDMLNKMILERCRNIVDGKLTTPANNQGPYQSKQGTNSVDDYSTKLSSQGSYQTYQPIYQNENSERN